MNLRANGKVLKEDLVKEGAWIITKEQMIEYGFLTFSLIKKREKVTLTDDQRKKLAVAFVCSRATRGCYPVYDPLDLLSNKMIEK